MADSSTRRVFRCKDAAQVRAILGFGRMNVQSAMATGAKIESRSNRITVSAPNKEILELASQLVYNLKEAVESGKPIQGQEVQRKTYRGPSSTGGSGGFTPKNAHQKEYLQAIRDNDLVFGLGAAGTGKTYVGVACAVQALQNGTVKKILISRPAVEAGEKLGFLPGTFQEKVDPYLIPIYDALNAMVGKPTMEAWRKDGRLEIAPLAFMRGRTLSNSFVLLDEAQNCTWAQIIMLITRMGEGSKIVVTGDESQTDLRGEQSGLMRVVEALRDVEGVQAYRFGAEDVVRHPLVSRIVQTLEKAGMRSF